MAVNKGRAQTADFLFDCRLLQIPAAAVIGLLRLRPESSPFLIRCRADAARLQINVFRCVGSASLCQPHTAHARGSRPMPNSYLAYTVFCILCRIHQLDFFSTCGMHSILLTVPGPIVVTWHTRQRQYPHHQSASAPSPPASSISNGFRQIRRRTNVIGFPPRRDNNKCDKPEDDPLLLHDRPYRLERTPSLRLYVDITEWSTYYWTTRPGDRSPSIMLGRCGRQRHESRAPGTQDRTWETRTTRCAYYAITAHRRGVYIVFFIVYFLFLF